FCNFSKIAGMIKKIPGETWKLLEFPGWKQLRKKYALSSLGRVSSYAEDIHADGKLLSGSLTTGYKTLNLHRPDNNGTLYIHREIARVSFSKISKAQVCDPCESQQAGQCLQEFEMGYPGRDDRSPAEESCQDCLQEGSGKPDCRVKADCYTGEDHQEDAFQQKQMADH